ncbi:MAG: tetratricopeptide repeat protein [Myxococcales bacterium FL481]|nr:MAG: tetratricopeptide repeat protein [Myxococcales bacterium FL481]
MDKLQQIKTSLKQRPDWAAVVDEVEAEIGRQEDAAQRSAALFDLARVCEEVLLDKARAMKCYQQAFKLDQRNAAALTRARTIYAEMAHLDMVVRLAGLEARNAPQNAEVNHALGMALLNQGQTDRAREHLERAAQAEPDNASYAARLSEVQYDRENWSEAYAEVEGKLRTDTGAADILAHKVVGRDPSLASRYLHCARILQQESPQDPRLLPLLFKALEADPSNDEAGFIAEILLAQAGQLQHVQKLQDRRASLATDDEERLRLFLQFAGVWQVRLNNPAMAAYLYRQALELAYGAAEVPPWHLAAYRAVRIAADEAGDADGLVPLAERGLKVVKDQDELAALAIEAGDVAWRTLKDNKTAAAFFQRAGAELQGHPTIAAFLAETQGGAAPRAAATSKPSRTPPTSSRRDPAPAVDLSQVEGLDADSLTDEERSLLERAVAADSVGGKRAIDAWRDASHAMPHHQFPRQRLKELYETAKKWSNLVDVYKDEIKHTEDLTRKQQLHWELVELYRERLRQPGLVVTALGQLEKLAESAGDTEAVLQVLEAQQRQFEDMKRWPDYIGRIRRRAELTEDPAQKVALNLEAGNKFLEKFNNQAEAIRSYEAVLTADEYNAEAIGRLKELYGRRRDWEKMIDVQRRELVFLEDPGERHERLLEIARVAGTKIKKPELSIALWSEVLDIDPTNLEALEHLEHMQERSKNWPALAKTLSTLVEVLEDIPKKSQYLVKLGVIYSEKIDDPALAVQAWEQLYDVDPNNRRAKDALKKLYLGQGDMDKLEAFYAKQDKWAEFIRVLEREVESGDGAPHTDLLLKIAQLYSERLNKPERAVRTLERALDAAPDDLAIAEALIARYEEIQDERHLVAPLEIKLRHTDESQERLGLLTRLADLALRVNHDSRAAFDYHRERLAVNHELEDAVEHLRRLGSADGRHAEIVEALDAAARQFGSTHASIPLRLASAEIYETELGDLERALAIHQAVLEIDPEQAQALASLERIYLAQGREQDLLRVLNTKLSLAPSPDERRQTQTRIGSIHEQLGAYEEAADAYTAVLADGEQDANVLAALDRVYTALERWPELADVLRRALEQCNEDDSASRVGYLARLAALYEDHLQDAEAALELWREVLEHDATHASARSRLERRLDDPALRGRVVDTLLPIYEQAEAWPEVVRCLEIQVAEDANDGTRVGILLRIGAISSQVINDHAAGFEAYSRAFRLDPANTTARDAIEHLAALDSRWADLAELFESAVGEDLASELLQSLLGQLAAVYDQHLGQADRAIACHQRALELDPENAEALHALQVLYERNERWEELLSVFRRKIALEGDPLARQQLRFQVAYLQEEMLGRVDDAIATYSDILADDEHNAKAIVALDRLYQSQERWTELAEILERQLLAAADPDEQVTLNLRLGEIRLHRTQQAPLAVELFRRVLELDPGNDKAAQTLESLLEDPDQQLSVARILEPLYRARNEWGKLIRAYEIMVERSLDPTERLQLLSQISELHEIAGDQPDRAFAAMGRAFKEDPANQDVQRRLESLAEQMEAHAALVELYEEAISDIVDDHLRVQVLGRIAVLFETVLADPDRAARAYERILEIDPGTFEAMDALIELHRRTNNYDALVDAVTRKASLVDNPDDRKQLLLYAANVRETVMDSPQGAIDQYQQVLANDDSDAVALDALEKLYIRLEDWEALKDIYTRKTELAEDPEERCRLLQVLGQVYDAELGDVDRAIDTYQAILDIDPQHHDAIAALDRLYGRAERWLDRLQVLERALEISERSEEQTSLRFRIAMLWARELNDPTRAVEGFRQVLAYDPGHAQTIAALVEMVSGDAEPVAAAQVLEPHYRDLGEWSRLVELHEVIVRQSEDPSEQVARLREIAALQEEHLGSYQAAFDAHARILAIEPADSQAMEQMQRLAEATGDWERFVRLLSEHAERDLNPTSKLETQKRIAAIEQDKLQDVDAAIQRYEEALEADPEDVETIEILDSLYTRLERWSDVVRNLSRKIVVTRDADDALELQFRTAQISQQNLGDVSRAVELYREVLAANPDHTASLQALELVFAEGERQREIAEILEPIYYSSEAWPQLVKLGEVKLEATEDADERLSIVQNVAEICERRLGEPGEAYIWWLRAYMDDPLSEQAGEEIERLAGLTQEWGYIVNVGDQILEADGGVAPPVRLAVCLRSAKVLEQHLQEPERAAEMYRALLEIDPEQVDALEALERLYRGAEQWEDVAETLRRRIGATLDGPTLVSLELRLGQVLEEQLSQTEQAIAAYERALAHDSRNPEALSRLEALHLGGGHWEALYENYQQMVDTAVTDEDMANCYQRMAKIASDALGREADAIDLWNRVLDLRGEDALALTELATLHGKAERWDDLVAVLERRLAVVEATDEKISVFRQLGQIYAEHLDSERQAIDAWLNVLDLDGDNVDALVALKKIYEERQAWVELIDVLQRLLALGPDALGWEMMRDLYAQGGRIQGEYLMQPDDAIEAWQRVLQIDERDMEALLALEQLYTAQGRWSEAIQVLERKSEVLEDTDSRLDVLMQIASLWEEKLDNRVEASSAYIQMLELDVTHVPAADALEGIYTDLEEWESLAQLLMTRAENTEDTEERVVYLQRTGKIFEEKLGDQDTAFEVLQAAFNVDYANEETSRELERLATEADKWNELLVEYNELVEQLEDPEERCELWVKIGRWYGEHLDRPDFGIQSLHKALEINADNVNALRELANFHRRAGDSMELAATLQRIVPLEQDPEENARVLLDLAEVQESGLQDLGAAIEAYRAVLEIDNESRPALDALVRLYEQQGQWPELVDVLRQCSYIANDPDEVLALRKRMGSLQETALADPGAAIETYRDIIESEPTEREVLQALERLYLGAGSVDEYLAVLDAQLDATVDGEEQIAIYEKMADGLVQHANDPVRAADVLEKIVTLDSARLDVYERLEHLYRELERWAELVETYRSHIEATEDSGDKIALLRALGEIFETEIQDVDRAVETYQEILDLQPDSFEAANVLSRLQEVTEDWPAAVETMGRLAELSEDPEMKLELLTRLGRVYFDQLADEEQAEARLNEALVIDPGYVPALQVLARLYEVRRDWLKAARCLRSASESSVNPLEKTQFAAAAGVIYQQELGDIDEAIGLFAAAMAVDPEHIEVGKQLAQMYYEAQRYEDAAPIYEMLSRKADQLEYDDEQLRDLYIEAGRTAEYLGDATKAYGYFKHAYDVDSTDYAVLAGMADILFKQEQWDKAFKLYQTILVQHRDRQSDDDAVTVYHRLGAIKRQQDQPRKALNYLEKALEVDRNHRPTLEAIVELQEAANDWEGVIEAKRALADVAAPEERGALLKQLGALYVDKLGNRRKAADVYGEALAAEPDDYSLLHTMLDLYTAAKDWSNAIATLDHIVEIEPDTMRRSRYNYTAAVLLRDEVGAHDEAIDRFNLVLDDDPAMLKAFQAIDRMVTKTRDWKTLERAYRKMLKRLPQDGEQQLKLTLWSNLGEVYRSRLRDYKSAAAAFEVALQYNPDDTQKRVILAELYEQMLNEDPEQYAADAVRHHQMLIASEPYRTESYHAMYSIFKRADQTDKAFCIAAVLVFLKKANDEEARLYQKYRRTSFVQARQRLSEDAMRKHVLHPHADPYLTAILGVIAPAVASWQAQELPPTIREADMVDIAVDPSLFSRVANYVKDALGVTKPDVYLRPQEPGDMTLRNIQRNNGVMPSLIVFSNMLRGMSETHLAFVMARHMAELYPPHYTYVALSRSTQNLRQVVLACMRAAGIQVDAQGPDTQALDQIAREVTGRMSAGQRDQLATLMRKFVESGGAADVKRWAAATELSCYRLALLLAGDLAVAAHMIAQEQAQLGSSISPKDKIKELVLYSISEDYFAVRQLMGLDVR